MRNLNTTLAHVSSESGSLFSDRRQEARVHESKVCAYSLCESIEGEQVAIEQGEVYSLDCSKRGILILMGNQPRNQHILELHVPQTRWEYAVSLYEVQWTKSLPVESHGALFLVGCRLLLEASRYWVFKPEMRRAAGVGLEKEQAKAHIPLLRQISSDSNSPNR